MTQEFERSINFKEEINRGRIEGHDRDVVTSIEVNFAHDSFESLVSCAETYRKKLEEISGDKLLSITESAGALEPEKSVIIEFDGEDKELTDEEKRALGRLGENVKLFEIVSGAIKDGKPLIINPIFIQKKNTNILMLSVIPRNEKGGRPVYNCLRVASAVQDLIVSLYPPQIKDGIDIREDFRKKVVDKLAKGSRVAIIPINALGNLDNMN